MFGSLNQSSPANRLPARQLSRRPFTPDTEASLGSSQFGCGPSRPRGASGSGNRRPHLEDAARRPEHVSPSRRARATGHIVENEACISGQGSNHGRVDEVLSQRAPEALELRSTRITSCDLHGVPHGDLTLVPAVGRRSVDGRGLGVAIYTRRAPSRVLLLTPPNSVRTACDRILLLVRIDLTAPRGHASRYGAPLMGRNQHITSATITSVITSVKCSNMGYHLLARWSMVRRQRVIADERSRRPPARPLDLRPIRQPAGIASSNASPLTGAARSPRTFRIRRAEPRRCRPDGSRRRGPGGPG